MSPNTSSMYAMLPIAFLIDRGHELKRSVRDQFHTCELKPERAKKPKARNKSFPKK